MKTTEENNRIIAEFMGFEQTSIGWFDSNEMLNLPYTSDNTFDNLLFHTSWDWLMKAVEKIESDVLDGDTSISIDGDNCTCTLLSTSYTMNCHATLNSKIESTYQAVVQFIEWYNQQKK